MAKDVYTYDSLHEHLARGELAPLYLLYGEEGLITDESVEEIIDTAFKKGGREFNLDVLSGADVGGKEIVARASSFPMMTGRRVVVVRDADRLGAKDLDLLSTYCDRPSPTTSLVLVATKPDMRKKPFVTVKRSGVAVESRTLYDSQLPGWIGKRVQRRGMEITDDASRLITAYVGSSLRDIQNELEKLSIYLGDKRSITADDVAAVVGMSREFSIFELQKAIGVRDIRRSTEILQHMIDAGESAPFIIVMLTGYFTNLWRINDARRRGKPSRELAGELRINPYFIQEYTDAAGRFPMEEIEGAFGALSAADEQLKTTMTEPAEVLHLLLVRILSRPEQADFEDFEGQGQRPEHSPRSGVKP